LLSQWLEFPFDKGIEKTDRLLTMQGEKIAATTVRISMGQKN